MTTIITRYFENADHAEHAKRELVYGQRVSPSIIRIYDSADGLAETLTQAHVAEDAAKEYEKRMGKGGAVVAVRAGYKPLGVAKITRDVLSAKGAADLGDFQEETFYKDERKRSLKILHEHPYMLTRRRQQSGDTYHMADFPIPLISRRKPYNDMVISRHGRMADKPIGLLLPGSKRYGPDPGPQIHGEVPVWPHRARPQVHGQVPVCAYRAGSQVHGEVPVWPYRSGP